MKRAIIGLTTLLGAAALGACATEGYVGSGGTSVATAQTTPRWQDPAYFSTRVHSRMDRIDARVRADVSAGRVQTQAIDALLEQRSQVESALNQASADGVVMPEERDVVRGLVRDMNSIEQRYWVGESPEVYGGGPIDPDDGWD